MATLRWKPLKSRWTLAKALAVGTMELNRMNTPERAELAQFLRNQFSTRLRTFTKAGTLGYAATKLVDDMTEVSENLMINMNP